MARAIHRKKPGRRNGLIWSLRNWRTKKYPKSAAMMAMRYPTLEKM